MVRNYMKKKGVKLRKKSVRQLKALKKKDQRKAAKYHKKAASYQKQLRVNKNNAAINKQMLANEKQVAKCKTEISAINQVLAQKYRGKKAKKIKRRARKRVPAKRKASRKRTRKPVKTRRTKKTSKKAAQTKVEKRRISQLKGQIAEAQWHISDTQSKISEDQDQVESATDTVNKFQDEFNKINQAQSKKQAATDTYNQAKSKLQEVQDYVSKGQRIYIPQGYNMDLMEKYSNNKEAYEPQMIKLSEQGLNDPRNTFAPSSADQQEKVDPKNLTSDQQKELTAYAAQLINDCRDQFGTGRHVFLNNSALKFARAVANEYQQNNQGIGDKDNDKWSGHYGPGITRAAQKFGLRTNSNQDNLYEDADGENVDGNSTMADLKGGIYDNIKAMMFGGVGGVTDTPREWDHASDLLGYDVVESAKFGLDGGKTYFGLCTSMKEDEVINHFLSVTDDNIIDKNKFNANDNINVPDLTSLVDQTTLNNKAAELAADQKAVDKAKSNMENASGDYDNVVDDAYYDVLPSYYNNPNHTIDFLRQKFNSKQNDLNNAKNTLSKDKQT